MNKQLQHFFDSFRLGNKFSYTFLTDLVSISLIVFDFTEFSSYVQQRALELLQGRSPEEIQQMIATTAASNPAQLQAFTTALWHFMAVFIVGLLILSVGSLLLFSYSRAWIWNYLQGKSVGKKHWRWNLLNLSLLIALIIFLLVLFLVRIIVAMFLNLIPKIIPVFYITHSALMGNVELVVDGAAMFYAVMAFVIIIFLIHSSFAKTYRVWDSIGMGFSLFKKYWKTVLLVALLATIIAFVITLILLPIKKFLIFPLFLSTLLTVALAAFFLSWLRLYVNNVILHGSQ